MSQTYGEPQATPGTATSPAPVPVPAGPATPADPAAEQAAVTAPAKLPPAGTVARYRMYDSYAVPARERDQLVLVTGHDLDDDGHALVRAVPLGFADDASAYQPEALSWQG